MNDFPPAPIEGQQCLRTDFQPPVLFEWLNGKWMTMEYVPVPASRKHAEEMLRVATKYLMDHLPERHAR